MEKLLREDNSIEYYLYINNTTFTEVNMKPYTYDGIGIKVNTSSNVYEKSTVFKIKSTNKELKYILLNDDKFEVSSLEEIN